MTQSEANHRQPLDAETIRAYVVEACGGDGEIVQQMVNFYLDSADGLLNEMHEGLVKEDYAVTRRAAHSLKSSSRMFSAETLADLCYTTELLAAEARAAEIPPMLPRIEAELRVLKRELPAFCAELVT